MSLGFEFESVAPLVGPFGGREFLDAWRRHEPRGEIVDAVSDDGFGRFWLFDGVLRFAGESDLTDYHTVHGPGASEAIAALFRALPPRTRVELDSMPGEVAAVVVAAMRLEGIEAMGRAHDVAAVLSLPSGKPWIETLGSKQRHEIRRKGRRFAEVLGDPKVARLGVDSLDRFFEMHRQSAGDKGGFMTPAMEALFTDILASVPGARLDGLVATDGSVVAAAFGFDDEAAYYLYNSAFEQKHMEQSPGIVLLNELIGEVASSGRTVFDFLKGDEVYKFRLGAAARPLQIVEATL